VRILNHFVILAAALYLLVFSFPAGAQEADSLQLSEQKIKAGLIYNFLKYTEWPADKKPEGDAPTIVCILGNEDPFSGYLEPIAAKTVHRHSVTLRHVSSTSDTGACHLLFVSAAEKQHWKELQTFLAGKHVLTVGDFPGFADEGGMIELGSREDHVYIELNVKAISQAQLVIYNELRRLSSTTQASPP